jgi:hypothetical protein
MAKLPFNILDRLFGSYARYMIIIRSHDIETPFKMSERKYYQPDWVGLTINVNDPKKIAETLTWGAEFRGRTFKNFESIFQEQELVDTFRKLLYEVANERRQLLPYYQKVEEFFSVYDKMIVLNARAKELEKSQIKEEKKEEKEKKPEKPKTEIMKEKSEGPKVILTSVYLKVYDLDIKTKKELSRRYILIELQKAIDKDQVLFYCSDGSLFSFLNKIVPRPQKLKYDQADLGLFMDEIMVYLRVKKAKVILVQKEKMMREYPILSSDQSVMTIITDIIPSYNITRLDPFYNLKEDKGISTISRLDALNFTRRDLNFLTQLGHDKGIKPILKDKFAQFEASIPAPEFELFYKQNIFPEDASLLITDYMMRILGNPMTNLENYLISGIILLPTLLINGTCKVAYVRGDPSITLSINTWAGQYNLPFAYSKLRNFSDLLPKLILEQIKPRSYKEENAYYYPIEKSIVIKNNEINLNNPEFGFYRVNKNMRISRTLIKYLFPKAPLKEGDLELLNLYVQIVEPVRIVFKVGFADKSSLMLPIELGSKAIFPIDKDHTKEADITTITIENDQRYIEVPDPEIKYIPEEEEEEEEPLWDESLDFIVIFLSNFKTKEKTHIVLTTNGYCDLYPYPISLKDLMITKIMNDTSRRFLKIECEKPEDHKAQKPLKLMKGNMIKIQMEKEIEEWQIDGFSNEIEGIDLFVEKMYSGSEYEVKETEN